MSLRITCGYNTLHVVSENALRYAKTLKRVDHADKEVLLFCVREKLYISCATVMAYHHKARSTIGFAITPLDVNETPVHLVHLTGVCLIPD